MKKYAITCQKYAIISTVCKFAFSYAEICKKICRNMYLGKNMKKYSKNMQIHVKMKYGLVKMKYGLNMQKYAKYAIKYAKYAEVHV